jgi:N-acetyl sugar amidotransferase
MNEKINYQICSKTVLDTIGDPDITFDESGVCNYYYLFKERLKVRVPEGKEAKEKLDNLVNKIKEDGKGAKYDCVIGVSGGVDSTYTAWLVKKMGLRPLAIHLDNGWNSELAVKNIENILDKLEIDLYTEVLDWEMFKDLQLSFLKASTPDGEIPTDHSILSIFYQISNKFNIKYVIGGMNFRIEGMLPPTWARGHLDWKYIRSVQKLFGTESLKKFPHLSIFSFLYYNLIKRIRVISFINYIDFNKDIATKLIEEELDWKNYGGKHHESIYTRFYQSYILPKKFNIDKRKAHLFCQIVSTGDINREQALEILKQPPANPELMEEDREYVIKKLGIKEREFEEIMNLPVKSINDYPNNYFFEKGFRKLLYQLRGLKILPN